MLTKLMRAPLKYIQGHGCLEDFYEESKDLGSSYFFICSNSGYKSCHDKLEETFVGTNTHREYFVFKGISSISEIDRLSLAAEEIKAEVIVGVGGGSAIDTAKAVADKLHKPVAIVPTVCATDAPCTGLSVLYNEDHTVHSVAHFAKNPEFVLVDTDVIAKAPVRFLVSGMGDALATHFETRVCAKSDKPSVEGGGITLTAIAMGELCYKTLLAFGPQAKIACENDLDTPALQAIVEATTYLSGVGVDNGGVGAAHAVYNGLKVHPELTSMHGECVAFGTLVQLILEAAPREEFEEVLFFCHEVGLPTTLADLGISDLEALKKVADTACAPGTGAHNLPGDVTAEQLYAALLTADAMGHRYFDAP